MGRKRSLIKDLKSPVRRSDRSWMSNKPEIRDWGFQNDAFLEVSRPWSRVGGQRSGGSG